MGVGRTDNDIIILAYTDFTWRMKVVVFKWISLLTKVGLTKMMLVLFIV